MSMYIKNKAFPYYWGSQQIIKVKPSSLSSIGGIRKLFPCTRCYLPKNKRERATPLLPIPLLSPEEFYCWLGFHRSCACNPIHMKSDISPGILTRGLLIAMPIVQVFADDGQDLDYGPFKVWKVFFSFQSQHLGKLPLLTWNVVSEMVANFRLSIRMMSKSLLIGDLWRIKPIITCSFMPLTQRNAALHLPENEPRRRELSSWWIYDFSPYKPTHKSTDRLIAGRQTIFWRLLIGVSSELILEDQVNVTNHFGEAIR